MDWTTRQADFKNADTRETDFDHEADCPESHSLSDRVRAACQLSPLFLSAYSVFDVDVDVSLLIEPVIVRLPLLLWACKADMKKSKDLRDQLKDLAQGDLWNISVKTRIITQACTHILANASAGPGTELNHRLVHPHSVALDPAVRVEDFSIRPKNILIVLYDSGVNANAVAFGKMMAGNSRSADGHKSGHCEPNARV